MNRYRYRSPSSRQQHAFWLMSTILNMAALLFLSPLPLCRRKSTIIYHGSRQYPLATCSSPSQAHQRAIATWEIKQAHQVRGTRTIYEPWLHVFGRPNSIYSVKGWMLQWSTNRPVTAEKSSAGGVGIYRLNSFSDRHSRRTRFCLQPLFTAHRRTWHGCCGDVGDGGIFVYYLVQ